MNNLKKYFQKIIFTNKAIYVAVTICIAFSGVGYVYFKSNSRFGVSGILWSKKEQKPNIVDLTPFSTEKIIALIPPFKSGKVAIENMLEIPSLREFVKKNGRVQTQRLMQLRVEPVAIVVKNGNYNLQQLFAEVTKITNETLISRTGNTYIFHVPILVEKAASLTLEGPAGTTILLSSNEGAFIANAGTLFIVRANVVGWNIALNKPSLFEHADTFRPFITSWSGARLYIASSALSSLGYDKGKAYGISLSTCPECLELESNLPRPTGMIVDSDFSDLYYGFYSYEADDVAIVGNTYHSNIVYGIDPHDRSRRLIIANNDCYGTKKKHGIIVSREVNDGWIVGNKSHNNAGSGIMLDRNSSGNIIALNDVYDNEQDGITFFESSKNITWQNRIKDNKKSGIRVRNSSDLEFNNDFISNNKGVGIELYTDDISVKNDRDLTIDPFQEKARAVVQDASIVSSGNAAVKLNNYGELVLVGGRFSQNLISDEPLIPKDTLDILANPNKALEIRKINFMSAILNDVSAYFSKKKNDDYLYEDGEESE